MTSQMNPMYPSSAWSGATPQGLCILCTHGTDCVHPRPGQYVRECAELETVSAPPERPREVRPVQVRREPVNEELQDAGRMPRGLCSSCERRFDCTFPRPEGGVWHCEEYC